MTLFIILAWQPVRIISFSLIMILSALKFSPAILAYQQVVAKIPPAWLYHKCYGAARHGS
jgi:hypothetical protein